MGGLEENDRGNEIGKVVGRDDIRDKVRGPTEVGVCLFILSFTTIRGRQTAIIGKLN